jgi:ATP-dependent protease Clp ATPase subunit
MTSDDSDKPSIMCSFCGKSTSEVAYVVASQIEKAFICNECVKTCTEVLFDKIRDKEAVERLASVLGFSP